jgi:hypothetical protein
LLVVILLWTFGRDNGYFIMKNEKLKSWEIYFT